MKRNKFVRQEPPKLGYGSYSMVTLSNPLIQLSMFTLILFLPFLCFCFNADQNLFFLVKLILS